jgi:hypothetical protein
MDPYYLGMIMNILKGIFYTIFFSFFIALMFALLFRLPIPMGEIIGPFGESDTSNGILEILQMVLFAWVFYGMLGGFIILSVLGWVAGHLGSRGVNVLENKGLRILKLSFIAAIIPIFFISTLDFFIGSW